MNEKIATKLMMAKRLKTETEKECKDASSREIGTTAEDIHLDDLYTRYRQRLRKSLFRSGLLISLVACVVSILIGIIFQQKPLLSRLSDHPV
uniref:Uncharacterized protein n=1 Tax=Glossina morsitans morsitans TaxID=37546 RepID=A0A1B0FA81_GLOMM